MQLVFATDDYVVAGRPREGFPILLWSSMESCVPANRFLQHYLQRGQISSKNSWTAIGRALYDYFGFLEANELSWDDVDRDQTQRTLVAGYRDYCLNDLRQRLNTVRLRLLYVCEFYEFAFKRGWIGNPSDIEIAEALRHQNALFLANSATKSRVRTLSLHGWKKALADFCAVHEISWELASHQFRRAFANYAARSQFGDLRYLREHFKHWSMDMTLGYALNANQEVALYLDILQELDVIKEGVAQIWLDPREPLSGGYGTSVVAWRGSDAVTIFKNHEHMVRSIAASTAIRSTGHAWCTADDNLCIGNDLERTRCSTCSNAAIGRAHGHIYQGMYDHLLEVAQCSDIGISGQTRVQRDLERCRSVLSELGYAVKGTSQ